MGLEQHLTSNYKTYYIVGCFLIVAAVAFWIMFFMYRKKVNDCKATPPVGTDCANSLDDYDKKRKWGLGLGIVFTVLGVSVLGGAFKYSPK